MLTSLFVQPPEDAFAISADLLARGFRRSSAGIAPVGLHPDRPDREPRHHPLLASAGACARGRTGGPTAASSCAAATSATCRCCASSWSTPRRRRDIRRLAPAYVETLYRELAPEHVALFVGELDGVPLAADLVTRCGGLLRGRLSGFDRSGPAARVSLPAAVRWRIVQWGKAEGCHWLDFGGLTEQTLDILLAGGRRPAEGWPAQDQPKLTFGGTAVRFAPAVELISSPLLRAAFDLAVRSRRGRLVLEFAARLLRSGRKRATPAGWQTVRIRRENQTVRP